MKKKRFGDCWRGGFITSEIFLAKVPETVTVAFAVLANKYGAGTARKVALESAGYNYDKVQSCVNDLVALFEKYQEGD